jgi:hypothetical protein
MLRWLLVLQLATVARADHNTDNKSDYSFGELMFAFLFLVGIFACIVGAWGVPMGAPAENTRVIKHVIVMPQPSHTAYYRREQGPLQEC